MTLGQTLTELGFEHRGGAYVYSGIVFEYTGHRYRKEIKVRKYDLPNRDATGQVVAYFVGPLDKPFASHEIMNEFPFSDRQGLLAALNQCKTFLADPDRVKLAKMLADEQLKLESLPSADAKIVQTLEQLGFEQMSYDEDNPVFERNFKGIVVVVNVADRSILRYGKSENEDFVEHGFSDALDLMTELRNMSGNEDELQPYVDKGFLSRLSQLMANEQLKLESADYDFDDIARSLGFKEVVSNTYHWDLRTRSVDEYGRECTWSLQIRSGVGKLSLWSYTKEGGARLRQSIDLKPDDLDLLVHLRKLIVVYKEQADFSDELLAKVNELLSNEQLKLESADVIARLLA